MVSVTAFQQLTWHNAQCTQAALSGWSGYDGRHDSKDFAHLAAAVFTSQGFQVNLFSEMVPTPFVAAAVSYKVMLSHPALLACDTLHLAMWWLLQDTTCTMCDNMRLQHTLCLVC